MVSMIYDCVKKIIKPTILAAKSYHIADASGFVKLDAMENPYVWPEKIKDEWSQRQFKTD